MPDLPQLALDATVAPGRVGCGHLHDQGADRLHDRRPAEAPVDRCPLRRDQLAVPPEDRVRRGDPRDLAKRLPPNRPPEYGEAPALTRREPQPSLADLLAQDSVLLDEVGDRARLVAVDEAREGKKEKAERQKVRHGEVHRISAAPDQRSIPTGLHAPRTRRATSVPSSSRVAGGDAQRRSPAPGRAPGDTRVRTETCEAGSGARHGARLATEGEPQPGWPRLDPTRTRRPSPPRGYAPRTIPVQRLPPRSHPHGRRLPRNVSPRSACAPLARARASPSPHRFHGSVARSPPTRQPRHRHRPWNRDSPAESPRALPVPRAGGQAHAGADPSRRSSKPAYLPAAAGISPSHLASSHSRPVRALSRAVAGRCVCLAAGSEGGVARTRWRARRGRGAVGGADPRPPWCASCAGWGSGRTRTVTARN